MTYQSELRPEPFPSYARGSHREPLELRHYEYQDNQLSREVGSDSNGAGRIAERAAVKSRVAAGQHDPNVLTDLVFFRRHPELRARKLHADQKDLIEEWKVILRNVVLPELGPAHVRPAAGAKISDREVGETLAKAAKEVPGLGITLEELLLRHQADAGGMPIELLLAFIQFESGKLFDDPTAGYWDKKSKRYIPRPAFYELGVFQTPAGYHGCVPEGDKGDKRTCKYGPPGYNVRESQFGKGWYRLTRTYPNAANWKDPVMQVRIGLWDLSSTAERMFKEFRDLFPSKNSEWYFRMAVLYSFAAGSGWTRAFLSKYKNELVALPESQRWDFLRGKQAYLKGYGTKTFDPANVDKKMALAAKLRAVRGATVTQPPAPPSVVTPVARRPRLATPTPAHTASLVLMMSPLAIKTPRGWNTRGGKRKKAVWGIVVHTTGSGPATMATEKNPYRRNVWKCKTPIECALALYAGREGFPHYVIDYDGTIYSVSPEDHEAWHAGWTVEAGGRARWTRWSPPASWSKVWGVGKTPLDLIPSDANSPNTRHIGIELLGNLTNRLYSDAQYKALARLVVDIERRYGLDLAEPPNPRLLGHEDVNPLTGKGGRADAYGGWDPGAHRRNPRFSWSRLANVMREARSGK